MPFVLFIILFDFKSKFQYLLFYKKCKLLKQIIEKFSQGDIDIKTIKKFDGINFLTFKNLNQIKVTKSLKEHVLSCIHKQ